MKKKKFGLILTAAAMAAMMALSGCGSSAPGAARSSFTASESAYDAAGDYGVYEEAAAVDMDMADNKAVATNEAGEVADTNRKLITKVNLSAETDDLDATVATVEKKVRDLGGYIESSNVYNGSNSYRSTRSASLTARVPAKNLDSFVETVEGLGNIVSKSVNVDDVTLTYVDIESKRNSLRTEEKRLLEIMESAETVEDIIAIEDKLANVRYELESIESQLRSYDNMVDYSTVYLDIEEVAVFTPVEKESALTRMGKGFMNSLAEVGEAIVEFCVWLVSHIPQLLFVLIVIGVIALIIKAIVSGSRKRKQKKLAGYRMQYQQNVSGANPGEYYNPGGPVQNVNPAQNAAGAASGNDPQNVNAHTGVNAPEKGNDGNKQ